MNSTIATTQPRAAVCPDLVHGVELEALARELPRMTPERLWFLTEDDKQVPAPKLAATMPNGDHAFAWNGQVYAMTGDEWWHYDHMRRTAA